MLAKKHRPDVVLLDVAIPGGDAFELVSKHRKILPGPQFVILLATDNPTYMARAIAAGAANFLLKSASQKELVTAIEHAASGKSPSGAAPFMKVAAAMEGRTKSAVIDAPLTPRETQVLCHVAYGLSNHEIAQSLDISVETVKEHVQNLLRKLAVNDRTQAAVWAVQSGLV